MLKEETVGLIADALATHDGYRVLRRLDLERRLTAVNDDTETSIGVCIDCETNSLDTSTCRVVEISCRRFRYDGSGHVTKLDVEHSWLEDPGEPLDPQITALTGLTDDDLRGQAIDERAASSIIASAGVRIAFNAAYDRPVVERRLPKVAGLPWACAMKEVDWRARGFDGSGRSLSWLLAQAGWFHGAHRAGADVDGHHSPARPSVWRWHHRPGRVDRDRRPPRLPLPCDRRRLLGQGSAPRPRLPLEPRRQGLVAGSHQRRSSRRRGLARRTRLRPALHAARGRPGRARGDLGDAAWLTGPGGRTRSTTTPCSRTASRNTACRSASMTLERCATPSVTRMTSSSAPRTSGRRCRCRAARRRRSARTGCAAYSAIPGARRVPRFTGHRRRSPG